VTDYKNLFETFLWAVKSMREYQKIHTPGTPAAIRAETRKWEQEVDALIDLHMLPELLPFPDQEEKK